jgi:hypothetical protein
VVVDGQQRADAPLVVELELETGEQELYDRRTDPSELRNVAAAPAYAQIKARLAAKLAKLDRCRGRSCNVTP